MEPPSRVEVLESVAGSRGDRFKFDPRDRVGEHGLTGVERQFGRTIGARVRRAAALPSAYPIDSTAINPAGGT